MPRLCSAAAWVALTVAVGCGVGCGSSLRRFPLAPVLWDDPDRVPFAPAPEERWASYYWDAMDHMVFRPVSEALWLQLSRPSVNVNALDEVPDSSWFVNRIGRRAMSPEEVAAGACGALEVDMPVPWTITSGKSGGASPGFTVRDANGVVYLLKADRPQHPEQSTAADPIVASVFHAAGYHVPCNRVVLYDASVLRLDPEAELGSHASRRRPMTQDDVRAVLAATHRAEDGRLRMMASRHVEGVPLGPWSYTGTWDRDPNDVVPHEHRRELRGSFVLDAWVNHWDARAQNSLTTFVEVSGGGGYMRHYLLDFGESLGLIEGNYREGARFGHTTWLDFGHMIEDLFGLGIVQRPWDGRTPDGPLGYYSAERFDPASWRPQYWNGALDRRTEEDDAWMARILARFTDAHVRALARLGRYSNEATTRRLVDILVARRDALLERYLTRRSPLTGPRVDAAPDGRARVCLEDLAVTAGVRAAATRRYRTALFAGEHLDVTPVEAARAEGATVCVTLARLVGRGGSDDYRVLDVVAASEGRETTGPLRLHLIATGVDEITVVGLERPASPAPPRP